jgi:hypothetical protein
MTAEFCRAVRRVPALGWLALGFLVGLFGGGYHSHHTTTVVEREYDDGDCVDRENCDGDA